jgi:hypothetical protein
MKKLLLTLMAGSLALAVSAQTRTVEAKRVGTLPAQLDAKNNKTMAVQDTLTQPIFGANCDPSLYTFGNGNSTITGTFALNPTTTITDVAQLLNIGSRPVSVEALLFFVTNKEEGPAKGSFTAEIYDTLGGPSPLRPDYSPEATSTAIGFDNIDSTFPGINRFVFPTPYGTAEPFWASLKVDNGSDTVAIYATSAGCGGAQPTALFNANGAAWTYYASVFTTPAPASAPLDFALWVWAEVDTSDATIGLEPNFITNTGLKAFPNPANNVINIAFELPSEQELTLVVQDMAGREVARKTQRFNGTDRQFELDLSDFEAGPHTYQVVGEKKQLNGIFVKQ